MIIKWYKKLYKAATRKAFIKSTNDMDRIAIRVVFDIAFFFFILMIGYSFFWFGLRDALKISLIVRFIITIIMLFTLWYYGNYRAAGLIWILSNVAVLVFHDISLGVGQSGQESNLIYLTVISTFVVFGNRWGVVSFIIAAIVTVFRYYFDGLTIVPEEDLYSVTTILGNKNYLNLLIPLIFVVYIMYIFIQMGNKTLNRISLQRDINLNKLDEVRMSLTYAQRIQNSIMPPINWIKEILPKSLLIYKPKDIISGDFYWFEEKDGFIYLAAADSTGHGIPGALVSMVCAEALNEGLAKLEHPKPSEILDSARIQLTESFKKSKSPIKDGMDISLCKLDMPNRKVSFSGANNSLYLVTEKDESVLKTECYNSTHMLIKYDGDRQPVGEFAYAKDFTQKEIQLKKGDVIFLTTDGYADQFGGEFDKKYKSKRLKQLFLAMYDLSIEEQEQKLNDEFEKWKGSREQVDDVCIIGIKIS